MKFLTWAFLIWLIVLFHAVIVQSQPARTITGLLVVATSVVLLFAILAHQGGNSVC